MNLSANHLDEIRTNPDLQVPAAGYDQLPERVLQFGTGVLLRGLPDYFIDKANKKGIFNGRVVMVKSTSHGDTQAFEKQDGLYTLCVKGIEEGRKIEQLIVNAAISRVLSAREEWDTILACAASPAMQVVISNTTEVGISLVEDDIKAAPPVSFPGKLLAFLYARYQALGNDPANGMVIVPTELIPGNGDKLRGIVLELAGMNKLDAAFIEWVSTANHFCNSLVDRIVPGALPPAEQQETENRIGYTDELMIMAEPYRLWAIESSEPRVQEILSFSEADEGMLILPDIETHRELKLRLLNGTHTFSCGLACLAGFGTVKEAMDNPLFADFITRLMMQEIAPAITSRSLSLKDAYAFAGKVQDRFRNPFIEHQWLSITMQYSSKMQMRNVPILLKHYEKRGTAAPHAMALGFAAYLVFMKSTRNGDQYTGEVNGTSYTIRDTLAGTLHDYWQVPDTGKMVDAVLADESLWGTNLAALEGFAAAVKGYVNLLMKEGGMKSLQPDYSKKAMTAS